MAESRDGSQPLKTKVAMETGSCRDCYRPARSQTPSRAVPAICRALSTPRPLALPGKGCFDETWLLLRNKLSFLVDSRSLGAGWREQGLLTRLPAACEGPESSTLETRLYSSVYLPLSYSCRTQSTAHSLASLLELPRSTTYSSPNDAVTALQRTTCGVRPFLSSATVYL